MAVLLGAALLASCDKNAVQDLSGPLPGARIKFFNFGVNAPGVNFYANDTKMTATSSATGTESTIGVAYGGVGAGGFYSAIAPGSYTITGKIAAATDKDRIIATASQAIADGKSYSYFISGVYNTTAKTADAFVVEDPVPATMDYTSATVRFVNAISNAGPQVLYAKNTTTGAEVALGTAVAYKSAGTFVTLAPGVYDLSTRAAGSNTNLISRAGVSFLGGRVYTIASRGDMTVTSGTAANRPQLDNTANR